MFFMMKNTYLTGYADDNTPFEVRHNTKCVIKALAEIIKTLINCLIHTAQVFH